MLQHEARLHLGLPGRWAEPSHVSMRQCTCARRRAIPWHLRVPRASRVASGTGVRRPPGSATGLRQDRLRSRLRPQVAVPVQCAACPLRHLLRRPCCSMPGPGRLRQDRLRPLRPQAAVPVHRAVREFQELLRRLCCRVQGPPAGTEARSETRVQGSSKTRVAPAFLVVRVHRHQNLSLRLRTGLLTRQSDYLWHQHRHAFCMLFNAWRDALGLSLARRTAALQGLARPPGHEVPRRLCNEATRAVVCRGTIWRPPHPWPSSITASGQQCSISASGQQRSISTAGRWGSVSTPRSSRSITASGQPNSAWTPRRPGSAATPGQSGQDDAMEGPRTQAGPAALVQGSGPSSGVDPEPLPEGRSYLGREHSFLQPLFLGDIWEVSGRYLGGIREVSERYCHYY